MAPDVLRRDSRPSDMGGNKEFPWVGSSQRREQILTTGNLIGLTDRYKLVS
jgi:hypothetical protein